MRALSLVLLLCACGRGAVTELGQRRPTLPRPTACTLPFDGPDCCDVGGRRLGGAACVDDAYVCAAGALCACAGAPQTFHCTDYCGSDAFVSAVCGGDAWVCPPRLIATSSCPAGTCFGEPGELCVNPRCVDSAWRCDAPDGGVHDPLP